MSSYFSQLEIPGAGYYQYMGGLDALHQLPRRIITGEDAQWQFNYDQGYADGTYQALILDRDTM